MTESLPLSWAVKRGTAVPEFALTGINGDNADFIAHS